MLPLINGVLFVDCTNDLDLIGAMVTFGDVRTVVACDLESEGPSPMMFGDKAGDESFVIAAVVSDSLSTCESVVGDNVCDMFTFINWSLHFLHNKWAV